MKTYEPATPRAAFAAAAVVLSAATLVATVVLPEQSVPVAPDRQAPPLFQAVTPLVREALSEPYRIEVYGVREMTPGYRTAAERAPARNEARQRTSTYRTAVEPLRDELSCTRQAT